MQRIETFTGYNRELEMAVAEAKDRANSMLGQYDTIVSIQTVIVCDPATVSVESYFGCVITVVYIS